MVVNLHGDATRPCSCPPQARASKRTDRSITFLDNHDTHWSDQGHWLFARDSKDIHHDPQGKTIYSLRVVVYIYMSQRAAP